MRVCALAETPRYWYNTKIVCLSRCKILWIIFHIYFVVHRYAVTCCTNVDRMRWTNNGAPNIDPKIEIQIRRNLRPYQTHVLTHSMRSSNSQLYSTHAHIYRHILLFLTRAVVSIFIEYLSYTLLEMIHTGALLIAAGQWICVVQQFWGDYQSYFVYFARVFCLHF